MSDKTALLALDWGTSALRAWRVAADGTVLERRREPWGILSLPEGGYPAAFDAITAGWRADGVPAIACGMVGSRKGWQEVDYLPLPLDLQRLAGSLATVPCSAGVLHLVPGLLDAARPDVIRGEETEAVGVLDALGSPDGEILLVMPGTHSKWVRVSNQVIASFATFMTGELFALLTRHSILGQGIPPAGEAAENPSARDDAFRDGVRAAAADGLAGRLFSTRALMLTGRLLPALVPDYLSGLLIGEELLRGGELLRPGEAGPVPDRVVLVGDASLTRRYALAFQFLGRLVPVEVEAASVRGLYRIATAAGLVAPPAGDAPC